MFFVWDNSTLAAQCCSWQGHLSTRTCRITLWPGTFLSIVCMGFLLVLRFPHEPKTFMFGLLVTKFFLGVNGGLFVTDLSWGCTLLLVQWLLKIGTCYTEQPWVKKMNGYGWNITFLFSKGKLEEANQLTQCYSALLWLPKIDWSRSPHRSVGVLWSELTQYSWWNVELVHSLPLCGPDLKNTHKEERNSKDEIWLDLQKKKQLKQQE